jgi:hypothetical protein
VWLAGLPMPMTMTMMMMMMMMLTISHTMAHMRLKIALLQDLADLERLCHPSLANSAPETCQTWQT